MRKKIIIIGVVSIALLFVVSSFSTAVSFSSSVENDVISTTSSSSDSLRFPQGKMNDPMIISIDYSFKEPVLTPVKVGDETYYTIDMPDTSMRTQFHEPVLPYFSSNVVLPYGTDVGSVQVTSAEKILVDTEKKIVPGAVAVPDSYNGPVRPLTPDVSLYASSEPFPRSVYSYAGTQSSKGVAIATFLLNPVVITPTKGEVWYYPHLTLKIHLEKSTEENALFRGLENDYSNVASGRVDNLESLETYRDVTTVNSIARKYDLLIITTPALKNGFTPLVRAHNLEGITTMVRTLGNMSDIHYGRTVNQTCENIRNYIRQMYLRYGIDYVLLGGDIDVVPAPYLYFGEYQGPVIGPSDFYYACLDGPFNGNNNNRWGEPTDGVNGGDVDLRSEVSVGRACVGNMSEVGIFVNKTLQYMRTDPNDEYLGTMLMAGEHLFDGNPPIYGDDYMKEIVPLIPQDKFSIRTLYDSEWQLHDWTIPFKGSGGWPKQLMINEINNGTHIINHLGHSGSFTNMKLFLYHLGYDYNDLDSLNNTNLTFIYSEGCSAGAFDLDAWLAHGVPDCIAEYFTVKRQHGAFAGIWNSRDAFASESVKFHTQFWNAVFNRGISVISRANQVSKEDNIPGIIESQNTRWSCYQITYFGDPALAFRFSLHANACGPYTGLVGLPVHFTGVGVGGTAPYRFEWDLSDGAGIRTKQQNPVIKYTQTGTYAVKLTVIDATGKTDINQTTVIIAKRIVVDTQGPYGGAPHVPIWFMGQATGGFPPYSWNWDFGDNRSFDAQNASHTYVNASTYNVTLTVTDSQGHQCVGSTTAFIHEPLPVVWVDDDFNQTTEGWGVDRFANVTDGVSCVSSGGIVYVNNGTYVETVCIQQPMRVIGENKDSTIIASPQWDCGICIYSNSVTVTGFTIRDSPGLGVFINGNGNLIQGNTIVNEGNKGIALVGSSGNIIADNMILNNGNSGVQVSMGSRNNSITDNTITGNDRGIDLYDTCNDNVIARNTIQENGYCGISISSCDRNSIVDCIITDHTEYGIQLYYSKYTRIERSIILRSTYSLAIDYSSDYTTVVGNTIGYLTLVNSLYAVIRENQFESGGISLLGVLPEWNTHVIENNILDGRPIYYLKNTSGPLVVPSDVAQVILVNCSNVTIHGLDIENAYNGVQLGFSPDCSIEENTITVIYSPGSPWITSSPVSLINAPRTLIKGNVLSNGSVGIDIQFSPNSTFSNNTISGNNAGINSDSSSWNVFSGNMIRDNRYGFIMFNPAHDTIVGNTIANSSMYGLFFVFSFDNIVYHNNFINNQWAAWDNGRNSYNLSYPIGGNYWSSWECTGNPSQGQEYHVTDTGIDHYPFQDPDGWMR